MLLVLAVNLIFAQNISVNLSTKTNNVDSVIETVQKSFPLNVMYWVKNEDDTYEVLDGQQRTISICEYVSGSFSLNSMYFNNLTDVEQKQILDYKLMVYFCDSFCVYVWNRILRPSLGDDQHLPDTDKIRIGYAVSVHKLGNGYAITKGNRI